jgi:hypothetical protein
VKAAAGLTALDRMRVVPKNIKKYEILIHKGLDKIIELEYHL